MKSKTTECFWKCYAGLPHSVKKKAKKAYRLFQDDPYHPSLHFKRIHSTRPIFSVRITRDYRAVGIQQDNFIILFWIGSHSEYNTLVKKLKNAQQSALADGHLPAADFSGWLAPRQTKVLMRKSYNL